MKIIELNKEQLKLFLSNPNPFSKGCNGIINLIEDKLYKIYYKDFIDFYLYEREEEIDNAVNNWLDIESITNFGLRIPEIRLKEFERLDNTKSKGLITALLSYNGLFVGIEMKYYKNFLKIDEAIQYLDDSAIDYCLHKALELINDLLDNNIAPKDVKESNILVNPKTLEVVLIDLDGVETTYGPDNYINDYPYNKRMIMTNFYKMVDRLKKEKVKKLS
ncbi:MAG: hypothetical protein IJ068_01720 [Bacilli bacterium]|nr:hypothetical protein [Bacilli bacterium]